MATLSNNPVKGAIIPLLLLLIAITVYFFIANRENASVDTGTAEPAASWKDNTTVAPQKHRNPVQAQPLTSKHQSEPLATATIETWNPMGDAASRAEILSWYESRGNFDFEDPELHNDYKNYDIATLEKLSESGDLRAMHELSYKVDTVETKKEVLNKAVAWGSTAALMRLGTIAENAKDISNLSPEERKQQIMESLAYYEAAQIRGDWWGKISHADSVLNRYPTELTQQDKNYIEQRGREIYDKFQKERHKLDLGEFDNSTPDSVIKFYEEMTRPL